MACREKSISGTGGLLPLFCIASIAFWVCSKEPNEALAGGDFGGDDEEAMLLDYLVQEAALTGNVSFARLQDCPGPDYNFFLRSAVGQTTLMTQQLFTGAHPNLR
jgi:hypothetical protein